MNKSQRTSWLTKFLALAAIRVITSPIGLRALGLFLLFIAAGVAVVRRTGHSWLWLLPLIPVAFVASLIVVIRRAWQTVDPAIPGPHVYDKAKYHYDGDYPKGLPRRQAFVHTGMLVGWLIDHDMIAQDFLPETRGFKDRTVTGAQVYKRWDGCLTSEMLSEEGNRFLSGYYDDEHAQFLLDYQELLAKDLPSQYHVADTWENYEIIRRRIDSRYQEWKSKQPPVGRPS